MRVTSYSFTDSRYYELKDSSGRVLERFYLPDTFISEPSAKYNSGVILHEDNEQHKRFLNRGELSSMGFATSALFIAQFDTDKATSIAGGGGGGSTEIINVLDDASVSGDGVTDDSVAIDAIIAANSGKILYFPSAVYIANINVGVNCILKGAEGAEIRWSSTADPVITITSDCEIHDLYFNSTHASGKGIDNDSQSSTIINCKFRGFQNDATGVFNNEVNIYNDCIFEIHTATAADLGTLCWSSAAIFRNCEFIGNLGADVQDSTFYNCNFGTDTGSTEWGVHMPLGTVDNSGFLTTFSGDAKFYNCNFFAGDNAVTDTYAVGMGNAAHPEFYSCSFIGNLYGIYARSESTFKAEDCYFRAKMNTAGAGSVTFQKWDTGGWPVGVDGEGDSIIKGGKIVSGVYSIVVPASSSLGSLTIDGTDLEWDKLAAVNSGGVPQDHNEAFQYITDVVALPDSLFEQVAVTVGDQVIDPPFTPSGAMFVELANDAAGTRNVRLTRFYRNPDGFYKNGTILILRGVSDTNLVNVKNGYWAAEGTLTVNSSGEDVVLGNGDVAVYIYFTNTWTELTNFNLSQYMKMNSGGYAELTQGMIKLTRRSTVPSPTTDVLYLDDGTNTGGTPTLRYHNGTGWIDIV